MKSENKKPTHKKNTLLKNAQANAESIFFKRVFFSSAQEEFFSTLLFLIKLFSPMHKLTTNFHRHSYECKSLRGQFRTDIDRQIFFGKVPQQVTSKDSLRLKDVQ